MQGLTGGTPDDLDRAGYEGISEWLYEAAQLVTDAEDVARELEWTSEVQSVFQSASNAVTNALVELGLCMRPTV
jgi:hypothetical protein